MLDPDRVGRRDRPVARSWRGHPESWSAGLPLWGWHVAGAGLTRNVLAPLGSVAVPWVIGIVLLVQFLELPPGTTTVSDRGAVVPPELAAVPTIFAFAMGIVVGIVAVRTYQAWGRTMTTRRGRMRRPTEPG